MLIKKADFAAFLHRVVKDELGGITEILLPSKSANGRNGDTQYAILTPQTEFELNSYRTVDPTKMLFYLARERMLAKEFKQTKRIILGVKACDLKALNLLDKAMINEDFADPSYKHWRDNSFIVSTDCQQIGETCHCTLLGGKPFAEIGFDLNLSLVNDSYVVRAGSDKGNDLLNLLKENIHCSEENDKDKQTVVRNRQAMTDLLIRQNIDFNGDKDFSFMRKLEPEKWETESKECVGCGACTNICPSCYCLILNDESEANKFVKVRSLDSCQWNGYARVAGGESPRPKMVQRFRNRYLCKFVFMKMNFDTFGCTGCGRCTEACPANIDFRKVVKETTQVLLN